MSRSNAASLSTTKRKTSVERELNPKKPRLNDSVRNASTIQVQGKASTEQGVDVLSGSIVQAADIDTPVVIPDEEHKHTNGKEPKNLQVDPGRLVIHGTGRDQYAVIEHEPIHGYNEYEDDDEEEDIEKPLSESVQGRLDEIEASVGSLSKQYLKAVMKAIGSYGGGTNRDMAASIVEHCRDQAQSGSDLKEETKAVNYVHRQCWGGCGDSEGEEDY